MTEAEGTGDGNLKVFISYSRMDEDFAQELLAGLRLAGFEPYLDKHDIAPGEDWEKRIARLIEAADTVVFVVSPDSVSSERCAWEVERTVLLKKRLLPIVWRRVEDDQVPPSLKQLNYIFFDRPLMSVPALSSLSTALKTNLDWVREHTRIGEEASRWNLRERNEALLFRGDELAAAKSWLSSPPQYAPEPTLLHHEFIRAGEDSQLARESVERQRLDSIAAAQEERQVALDRARAALNRVKRAQMVIGALMFGIVVLGVTWRFQGDLYESYHWRFNMAPTVLAANLEREKAAKPGPDTAFKDCANGCPTMVVVPSGTYVMGSPESEPGRNADEGPQHSVTITRPFAVSRTEITFAEWDTCVAAGACPLQADRDWGRGNRPAIFVSWDDARIYAAWLSRMTGKTYRLLTEAEWEYVARAGSETTFPTGNDPADLHTVAWHKNKDGRTQTVGTKAASAFGLHDMQGNVWEWVEDCWNEGYTGKPPELARTGGSWMSGDCGRHVVRGGSWNTDSPALRSADRNRVSTGLRINDLGFRLARELQQ